MHWLSLASWLLAVHVLANIVWIGALLAVALVGSRAPFMADMAEVAGIARRVHLQLAVPAFVTSFVAGGARFVLYFNVYRHLPWMHAKLTFALVVIVLHHVIGARVRRVAQGSPEAGRGLPALAWATFACASVTVLFAIFKSLP